MIVGKRTRLRAMEREDLPTMHSFINDPETRSTLATYRPMSMADEQRWFDAKTNSSTEHVFAIDVVDGGAPGSVGVGGGRMIGACGLHNIDWKNRHCVVGIVIGRAADRGKGYGTDALRTLVKFAHDELGLVRVELEVFPHNVAGVKSYEKLGFRLDGRKRSASFRDGKFHDLLLMSVLPGELTKD